VRGAHPVSRPLAKAEAALNAFRASSDLDAAEDAWCDFLHNWVRCVNKYDAHTRKTVGPGALPLKTLLRDDERLTYLWEGRNTDEHTIEPVAGRTPAVALLNPIAFDVGDGLVVGPGGEVGITLGHGLSLTFAPGNLHLVAIRNRDVYNPPVDNGFPMTPLRLMEYGFGFLRRAVPEA
jgi:hypothetical protein